MRQNRNERKSQSQNRGRDWSYNQQNRQSARQDYEPYYGRDESRSWDQGGSYRNEPSYNSQASRYSDYESSYEENPEQYEEFRGEGPSADRNIDRNRDEGYQARNDYRNEDYSRGYSRGESLRSTYGSRDLDEYSPSRDFERNESYGRYAGKSPKAYKRSDDRIKEDIYEALTRHGDIDATDVDVDVKDGEVTLKGSVSDRNMKFFAESVAERVSGIKDVTNNIRVKREESAGSSTSSSNKKSASNPTH